MRSLSEQHLALLLRDACQGIEAGGWGGLCPQLSGLPEARDTSVQATAARAEALFWIVGVVRSSAAGESQPIARTMVAAPALAIVDCTPTEARLLAATFKALDEALAPEPVDEESALGDDDQLN